MAGVKAILGKFRLRRKTLILLSAALLLSATSGAAALYISKKSAHEEAVRKETSGLECTALRTIKLGRNGQRWIRKYVQVTKSSGEDRLRTALRVTGLLAKAEKADLYQVVVLDAAGPTERAAIRGAAIGAEVLFAPDPTKLPDMERPFEVAYVEGEANAAGLYQGQRIVVPFEDIGKVMTGMVDHTDCADPPPDPTAEAADGHGETKDHGGSSGHGEAPAEGHGDAPAEGHGDAPAGEHGAPAEGEHAAAADEHAAAPAEGEHGAPAEKESGGLLASLTGMIFGSSEETAPHGAPADGHGETQGDAHGAAPAEGHEAAPAEGAHGAAAEGHGTDPAAGHGETSADAHGAAPAEKPAEEAKGFFSPVTDFLFGADEVTPSAAGHGETPADGHAAAPAADAHATDNHAAPADAAGAGHDAKPVDAHGAAAGDHAPVPAEATGHEASAATGDHGADPLQPEGHDVKPADANAADAHGAPTAAAHETAATGADAAAHAAEGLEAVPASVHDAAPVDAHGQPVKKIIPPADDHAAAEPQPAADSAHAEEADAHGVKATH